MSSFIKIRTAGCELCHADGRTYRSRATKVYIEIRVLVFSFQSGGYQETVVWSLTSYSVVHVNFTCLSDYTASYLSSIREHVVQIFLWKLLIY